MTAPKRSYRVVLLLTPAERTAMLAAAKHEPLSKWARRVLLTMVTKGKR